MRLARWASASANSAPIFIERYLEDGTLIPLTDGFVEFRNRYCGYLTKRGRSRAIAQECLSFFEKCA